MKRSTGSLLALFGVSLCTALCTAAPVICEDGNGVLAARNAAPCPPATTEWRGAGANLFDAFWCASKGQGGDGAGGFTYNQSLEELRSAKVSGIRVFRAFASDWGPNKIYWKLHPDEYWAEFDRLFDDIDKSGMYWIPSIGTGYWYAVANHVTPGLNETANDLVKNASSVGRQIALEYFSQFTTRYSQRKSLLMWELGNELNLKANLPPPWCGDTQCFNTAEMVGYTQALVAEIRKVDTARPISSGFSLTRANAWHAEHCPVPAQCDWAGLADKRPADWTAADRASLEWRCPATAKACPADPSGGGYWGKDTVAQWSAIFAAENAAVNVWSVHHYDDPAPSACYFGQPGAGCVSNASVLTTAATVAASHDAMLYVGEYGGPHPNFTGPTAADQAFPLAVLGLQEADAKARGSFALSTIWAWECPMHRADMVCIWPNSTDPRERGSNAMIAALQRANAAMASP